MCCIIGVGERLQKVLGQIDLGTLDSGERSLPFGLLVLRQSAFDSMWHFRKSVRNSFVKVWQVEKFHFETEQEEKF